MMTSFFGGIDFSAYCPNARLVRLCERKSLRIAANPRRRTNGPIEALNDLIELIKRVAFGMRRLRHYRVRALHGAPSS